MTTVCLSPAGRKAFPAGAVTSAPSKALACSGPRHGSAHPNVPEAHRHLLEVLLTAREDQLDAEQEAVTSRP